MEFQKMISTSTYTSKTSWNSQDGVYQHVTIGAVTECQDECRFTLTPATAHEFILNGHKVCIQTGAGNKAGFTDEMYKNAGVTILNNAEAVYKQSNVILKVRHPETKEIPYIQQNQVIFCFVDQTNQTFFKEMMQRGAVVIGYQYLQDNVRSFPVFNAVTELMGYLGVQQAMKWLECEGKVFGQLGGVCGSKVLILGAGACGMRAALLAAGTGACVTVMDTCVETLRKASMLLPAQVSTLQYTTETLEKTLPTVDVLIGAALPITGVAPVLVKSQQMKLLKKGTFAIDLAIGFGGNFEGSKPTTLQQPTTTVGGVTVYTGHFITNLAPNTFTTTVGNSILPWALQVANKGWKRAVLECSGLQQAVCVVEDRMTNQCLATYNKLPHTPVEQVLECEIQQVSGSQNQNKLFNLKQQLTSLRVQQSGVTGFTIEA